MHDAFKWLWKTVCTPKIKVFGWLLLSDRLNTHNMLKRRHYNIGSNLDCLLCGTHIEKQLSTSFFIAASVKPAGTFLVCNGQHRIIDCSSWRVQKLAGRESCSWRYSWWLPGVFGRKEIITPSGTYHHRSTHGRDVSRQTSPI